MTATLPKAYVQMTHRGVTSFERIDGRLGTGLIQLSDLRKTGLGRREAIRISSINENWRDALLIAASKSLGLCLTYKGKYCTAEEAETYFKTGVGPQTQRACKVGVERSPDDPNPLGLVEHPSLLQEVNKRHQAAVSLPTDGWTPLSEAGRLTSREQVDVQKAWTTAGRHLLGSTPDITSPVSPEPSTYPVIDSICQVVAGLLQHCYLQVNVVVSNRVVIQLLSTEENLPNINTVLLQLSHNRGYRHLKWIVAGEETAMISLEAWKHFKMSEAFNITPAEFGQAREPVASKHAGESEIRDPVRTGGLTIKVLSQSELARWHNRRVVSMAMQRELGTSFFTTFAQAEKSFNKKSRKLGKKLKLKL